MKKPKHQIGRVTRWQEISQCGEILTANGKKLYFSRRGLQKGTKPQVNDVVTFNLKDAFYKQKGGSYILGAVSIAPAGWLDIAKYRLRGGYIPHEVKSPSMLFISAKRLKDKRSE